MRERKVEIETGVKNSWKRCLNIGARQLDHEKRKKGKRWGKKVLKKLAIDGKCDGKEEKNRKLIYTSCRGRND